MKKFIENNFTTIVLVIALLTFFKGCGDTRELSKIKKEITAIKEYREALITDLVTGKRSIHQT